MNKNHYLLLLIVSFFCISLSARKKQEINLFNAHDWIFVMADKTISPSTVFQLSDSLLCIQKGYVGYIRTRKHFNNFKLSLEWRWIENKGNSGVLLHIQSQDSIWPKCYQVQQKQGAAGDIICMNGLWADECTDKVKFTIPKMHASSEKPIGEWNELEVICNDNTLIVYVNAVLQNKITGLTHNSGYVGIQAEGQAMDVRNFRLIKIN